MATSPTYCTHRDIEDVYPNIDNYDSKDPMYGWVATTLDSISYYIAYNSGLVTQLFINGKSQQSGNQIVGTIAATLINSGLGYSAVHTTIVVDSGGALTDATYIKIGDEILGITHISTNTLTVVRAQLGTVAGIITDDAPVYLHFQPSSVGDNLYDADNDFMILKYGSDPNDSLTESGEDFSTLIARISKNASRYFDARVDSSLPRDQWKDKEGNYDYIIVRTVALIAACFQIKSHDPNSEALAVLEEEYNLNIALINSGQVALSNQVTSDSSKGILREVLAPQNANPLRIVDTRGNYSGIYDNIKIVVTTTGAIGIGKFSVYHKDSDSLKSNLSVTDTIINGSYQSIGSGLQVRFAGANDSSIATNNDEYELEAWGMNEALDNPVIQSVRMTRGGSTY